MIGDHPALIDFERSIIRREDLVSRGGESVVSRGASRGARSGLRALTTPPNRAAQRHAKELPARLRERVANPTVLVIGGGTVGNGAEGLYRDPALRIVAFDLYASAWTQWIADAHAIPLADQSVHAVWIQAVLEHVLDPWRAVAEIARVLVPNGLVYAETPFLQQVHEGPYDFTRFTESGHRWLFRRFERLDSGVVAGAGPQLNWTLAYVARGLMRAQAAGKAVGLATFWLQALDRLIPERYAVDTASCVYFFGEKSEREITPAEIVSHYRGAQRPRG
jgi:SAM-dependent methyltransferase